MSYNKIRFLLIIVILVFLVSSVSAFNISTYRLGPRDSLEIHAWDDENPDILYVNPIPAGVTSPRGDPHTIKVSLGGRIYIPLLGVVKVTGMTVGALERKIKRSLRKLTKNPRVVVFLKSPKGIRVQLLGEVNKPGLYSIADGFVRDRTLLNYLRKASGITDYGDITDIHIIRYDKKGKKKIIIANLMKISTELDLEQNMILQDGDVVLVPVGTNKVYLWGEVKGTGPKKYIPGATVYDYIVQAGGFTKRAAANNIRIVRGNINDPVIKDIKLANILEGQRDNVEVKPKDIIFVGQDWVANWKDTMAVVKLIRSALLIPGQVRDAYMDVTGQRRPVYFPTE